MNKHERFMRLAELAARKSTSRVRMGAVLVDGSRPIAIGINDMSRTHPLFYPANIHAELDAVLSAPYTVGTSIYVVRLLRNGDRALAAPCKRCMGLLAKRGIKKIWFSP